MKRIILIAGPSGAGKSTISEYLTKDYGIKRVITHTTRPKRSGEVDGRDYYFETDASFKKLHFFEHVKYGQYQYGSSKEALNNAWKKHELVSLIVDINGVRSYERALSDKIFFLYVTTSSIKTLRQRLLDRGDDLQMIENRMSKEQLNTLPADLKEKANVLINDSWPETVKELDKIVTNLTEK